MKDEHHCLVVSQVNGGNSMIDKRINITIQVVIFLFQTDNEYSYAEKKVI